MTKTKKPKETNRYKKHYSESGFWGKAKSLGKSALKPALLLYYVMMSPKVPFSIKTTIAGALGYLIVPLDLIPDFIPVAGYSDDIAALITIVKMCKDYITPEIKAQAEEKLHELLG